MSDKKDLVEKFQCPGCVCGSDTNCGQYKPNPEVGSCMSHVVGTIVGGRHVALGLPKGFCNTGWDSNRADGFGERFKQRNVVDMRFFKKGEDPGYDRLNVPTWAMVHEGYLLVRVHMPRIDRTCIDVIEGGTLEMVPKAIDVGAFINEID